MASQEHLKINVLLLLFESPQGIPLSQLAEAFRRFHGRPLNPLAHGYPSIDALLQDMNGMVDLQATGTCSPRLQTRVPGSQRTPIPPQDSPTPGVGLRPGLSLPPRPPINLVSGLYHYPPPRLGFGFCSHPFPLPNLMCRPLEDNSWPGLTQKQEWAPKWGTQPEGAEGGGGRMGPDVLFPVGQAKGEASLSGLEASPMTYSQALRSSTVRGQGMGSGTFRERGEKEARVTSDPTGKPGHTRQRWESNRGERQGQNGKEGAVDRGKQDPIPPDPREAFRLLLDLHPNGLSLFQLRQKYQQEYGCPLDPVGRPSLRALLKDMADIVSLQGQGVQERVFPHDPSGSSSAPQG